MHRILLVEDAPEMHFIIKTALAHEYIVTAAPTLGDAEEVIKKSKFDLILLDVHLPDGDSFKFCATLKATQNVPVIFLSGSDEVQDKVMGLTIGGSDYIVKPFSHLELLARIQARLRENQTIQVQKESLVVQDLCFDLDLQRVSILAAQQEVPLSLTSTEYKLLLYLAKHKSQILTRSQLLDAVWGNSTHIIDRTIDVHMSNLRKKLVTSQSTIKAIPRMGYQFIAKI